MAKLSDYFDAAFNTFDPSQYEPTQEFTVYPPGRYPCQIDSVEVKETKAGTGAYFEVRMTILEGRYKGQKLTDRINVVNPNQTCVNIGKQQLTALCDAAGITKLDDTDQFLQCIVVPSIKVKNEQNVIRTYLSMAKYQEKQGQQQQSPPSVAGAAPPAGNANVPPPTAPWARRPAA